MPWGFIFDTAMKQEQITEDNLMHLPREERTVNLFNDWATGEEDIHQLIKRLTIKGIFKYGFQLVS